jgi:hypothetical protein
VFWNQRFEYHMGLRLSRHYGISTLHERGKFILELARTKYKAEGKKAGVPAEDLAHIAIDEALMALHRFENPGAPELDLRSPLDRELDDLFKGEGAVK